jgi:hypothetical protein
MSPSAAKALLEKENALLAKFIDTVTQFPMTPKEAAVLNDWKEYFTKWRAVNTELRGLSDNDFKKRMRDERDVLKDMRQAIRNASSMGKFYKDNVRQRRWKGGRNGEGIGQASSNQGTTGKGARRSEQQGRFWHLADMLQCADECPLLEAKRRLTNRCLPISIYEYTA